MARRKRAAPANPVPLEDEEFVTVQLRYATEKRVKGAPRYSGGGSFGWAGGKMQPGDVADIPLALARSTAGKWVRPGSQVKGEPLSPRASQLIERVHDAELAALDDDAVARANEQARVQAEAEAKVAEVAKNEGTHDGDAGNGPPPPPGEGDDGDDGTGAEAQGGDDELLA